MIGSTSRASAWLAAVALIVSFCANARATEADDTEVTIIARNPGVTAFISQLTLSVSNTTAIKSVQFTVTPKAGSVTRPLSGTYANSYLLARGFLQPSSGFIYLPVYGLYANATNTVTITYTFMDGSSKHEVTTIVTPAFDDPCSYDKPTVLQPRSTDTALTYDFIMIKGSCDSLSPAVVDTDGALRWVGPGSFSSSRGTFYDNAFYLTEGTVLYRIELDGTVALLHDYSDIGVISFHHNIDRGKAGLILDANTAAHQESLNLEVDAAGNVLKSWDMVDIISAAMTAGGDDPAQFIVPSSEDWFHNNAVAYNWIDDSLIISSRENFLICLDYSTLAIKWILGDQTKEWFLFPSLASYALTLAPGSEPPVGQHAVSITFDQEVMAFDNGKDSDIHVPVGIMRDYASPRKWHVDPTAKVATEIWNYERDQSVRSGICSAVYEDQPYNYLINYSDVNGPGAPVQYADLLGLDAAENEIFHYRYPNLFCFTAFNAIPLHLENTSFPRVGPQALNISTRGMVGTGDNALIGGIIVTGAAPKRVVLRALGASLADSGVSGALADPVLTVFDSSGVVIAANDDWQTGPDAGEIAADGLAPIAAKEAATVLTLPPAAYTVVVTGHAATTGVGLIEAYDLSPNSGSKLANISTRGLVGTGDNLLISGFIVGDVANSPVIIRAIGPSLPSGGVSNRLSDPKLTIHDRNGSVIAENDNWQEDHSALDIEKDGLAPKDPAEAATALFLPPGLYSAVVQGAGDESGVGLVEVYDLN